MFKWTKRRPHISLGFIKIDQEVRVEADRKIFSPTIGLLAETETELEGITIITIETVDPTLEIDSEIITDVTTEEMTTGPMRDVIAIDKTIGGEIIIDKTIEIDKSIEGMTLDKEIGVKVEIGPEIIVMTVPGVETGVETEMDGCNLGPKVCQMTEEDQGLDQTQE